MGTTKNEEAVAWTEKAEPEFVDISRSTGTIGGKGKNLEHEQERDNRARSSESSIFSPGTAVTGGMLDHLISEYCDQVAAKQDDIHRIENEVDRLQSRVKEFKALREELRKQSESE
jgi:hypothetical protein